MLGGKAWQLEGLKDLHKDLLQAEILELEMFASFFCRTEQLCTLLLCTAVYVVE